MDVFDRVSLYNKPPEIKRLWKKKRDKIKSEKAKAVFEAGIVRTPKRVLEFADGHRRHQTRNERAFRSLLNKCRILHYFEAQVPLFGFILDFYCKDLMLCIEIDGKSHNKQKEYDEHRTKVLYINGIKVLRFTNKQVRKQPFEVMSKVCQAIGVNRQLSRIRKTKGKKGKIYLAGENTQEQLAKLIPSFNSRTWNGPKEPYVPKWLS